MAERPTPMAHATLIMVVSAGRVPVAIATPGRARLDWRWRQALGAGYGARVVLVGPSEVLAAVVDSLDAALRAWPCEPVAGDPEGPRDAPWGLLVTLRVPSFGSLLGTAERARQP